MARSASPTIAVFGAGAIGGWVAARLAIAGNQLMALTRQGAVGELELRQGGTSCKASFTTFESAADLLIIAVKAPALADAARAAAPLIGPETLIVPMLNGVPWWFTDEPLRSVDPDGRIADALPIERVIGCVIHASCRRASPAQVEVVHAEKLILGEPSGGTSERIAELCALFERGGIRCEASDNIRQAIWYKLWGNATINPLSALTRATADRLLGDPVLRGFMAQAMDELAEVGAAIGCPIGESADDRMAVTARLGAFKSSMLQDVEAGRAVELEALLGAPREIAGRAGIATPRLDLLHAMTAELARSLNLPSG